eukprot:Hpha_TRINITY_DN15262_c1_g16::TRINITY_DN15262_c1_g16_i1::g.64315::m.64315
MSEKQEMVVRIDGKKFMYKGKPEAKQRDFFEMLVKLKKGAAVPGEQLADNWKANFGDEEKSESELLGMYQKEVDRQERREKEKRAKKEREAAASGGGTPVHADPAESAPAEKARSPTPGSDQGGRLSGGRSGGGKSGRTDAEHKEIQAFIDRILNEDEDDEPHESPPQRGGSMSYRGGMDSQPRTSPPATSRTIDAAPGSVKFKLDAGTEALKVISLKKQPEGMFEDLKKIAAQKCEGVQRLCFVDRDGDTIDVDDDESLDMFFIELEQRQAAGERLVMKAVFKKDEPQQPPPVDPGLAMDESDYSPPPTEPPMTARRRGIESKHTLKGHNLAVYTCAMNPQGTVLVTGSKDGRAKVWSLQRFSCLSTVQHVSDSKGLFGFDGKESKGGGGADGTMVLGVDVTRDGKLFATSGDDKIIRIWDASGGKMHSLRGHSDKVYAIAFSPNGKSLASASNDNTVKLWDVETGTKKVTLRGHTQAVFAVSWSNNGKMLCSGSHDQTLKIWDAESEAKTAKRTVNSHEHCIWSCVFSPNDKEVLSTSMGKDMLLWDVEARRAVWKVKDAHKEVIHRAIFIRDGQYIASVARDGAINLWDPAQGTRVYSLARAHRQPIYCLCTGGFFVATSSLDRTVNIWHVEDLIEAAKAGGAS